MKALIVFTSIMAALTIGYWNGWDDAHVEVAEECARQGGFYVGKKDYKCEPAPARDGGEG